MIHPDLPYKDSNVPVKIIENASDLNRSGQSSDPFLGMSSNEECG